MHSLVRMSLASSTLAPVLFGNPMAHSSPCGRGKCSSFYPHIGHKSHFGGNYRHLVVKDVSGPQLKPSICESLTGQRELECPTEIKLL